MHLYSNNLSNIAKIAQLTMSELIPACFSCGKIFNLSQNSSGSDGKKIVENPEAMIAGDFSCFLRVPTPSDLLAGILHQNSLPLEAHTFLSGSLLRSIF